MIDELQYLRMYYVWPFVVAATAFFAARLILYYANGMIERQDIMLAGFIATLAAIVARRISETWIDDAGHWLAFTLGLTFLAVILVGTGLIVALGDTDEADRRQGRW